MTASRGRHHVLLVLDSCRWDTFLDAAPPNLLRLGRPERRHAWATWTPAAHHAMLTGLLPHRGGPGRLAGDVYRECLGAWRERLGRPDLDLAGLLPHLWLPTLLRRQGFQTEALVSLPVLHPATPLNRDFDRWLLARRHDDLGALLDHLRFPEDRPAFVLLNTGETHYPYTVAGQPPGPWPRLPGLHGVAGGAGGGDLPFFTPRELADLRARQVAAVQGVDRAVGRLFDLVPAGTWVTVTADHGELFGEDGCFGHGPVVHPKVLEVPFVEGIVP